MKTHCTRCQAPMTCNPEGDCWCAQLPRVPMPADAKGCFCPDCLQKELRSISEKVPDPPVAGEFDRLTVSSCKVGIAEGEAIMFQVHSCKLMHHRSSGGFL